MKKIISLLLVFTLLLCGVCFAWGEGITVAPKAPDAGMVTTTQKVLGVMQWVGYAIAIGMIIFCGIKYIMSGAGEKAKVKETLVPLLIGAILIAGATTIATAIFSITDGGGSASNSSGDSSSQTSVTKPNKDNKNQNKPQYTQ